MPSAVSCSVLTLVEGLTFPLDTAGSFHPVQVSAPRDASTRLAVLKQRTQRRTGNRSLRRVYVHHVPCTATLDTAHQGLCQVYRPVPYPELLLMTVAWEVAAWG